MTPDLTLEETAIYLRLSPERILRRATQGNLPGRKNEDNWRFLKTQAIQGNLPMCKNEDNWRFLKAVINDWLRSHDSRTLLLQQAGALADDEFLAEMRAAIYQARERPEVDEDLSL